MSEREPEATPEIYALHRRDGGWKLSRREFLGAAVASGIALAGCGSPEADKSDLARAHKGAVTALTFRQDGAVLASGGEDTLVKLWAMPEGAYYRTFYDHDKPVRALAFVPGRELLASGGEDGGIRLWSLSRRTRSGRLARPAAAQGGRWGTRPERGNRNRIPSGVKVLTGAYGSIGALVVSPDGKTLVSGGEQDQIRLWSLPGGEPRGVIHQPATALALSADGSVLYSAAGNQGVCLWGVQSHDRQHLLRGDQGPVRLLAPGPRAGMLACASGGKSVRLWHLPDGKPLSTLQAGDAEVKILTASADGKWLAAAGLGFIITLWALPAGAPGPTFTALSPVTAVAINPTGTLLAAGDQQGRIYLWSLRERALKRKLIDLAASTEEVKGVTFQVTNEHGERVVYTLPCGATLPPGAACICDCVRGSIELPHTSAQGSGSSSGSGGGAWSHETHYWYPN